ncbi:MAG: envelope stress response membrane protein PspB [Xanthomonadales bacterium]|nr:envelope stress response membrane protein PspB [Xanthomonadales bacterium]
MEELIPIFAIFCIFIGLPWIIFHYGTRNRAAQGLSREDEKMLADLWQLANRMERRLESLETILDTRAAGWREKP